MEPGNIEISQETPPYHQPDLNILPREAIAILTVATENLALRPDGPQNIGEVLYILHHDKNIPITTIMTSFMPLPPLGTNTYYNKNLGPKILEACGIARQPRRQMPIPKDEFQLLQQEWAYLKTQTPIS